MQNIELFSSSLNCNLTKFLTMSSFNITPFPPQTGIKRPVSIESWRQCRSELPAVKGGWRPLRRLASPMLLFPPRSPQKNEPPMRGSLALSEFVPKNQGYPIWRNDFGAKNGAQAKRRVEAYWHTRESSLSRSNSFLAQKHSPNQATRSTTTGEGFGRRGASL